MQPSGESELPRAAVRSVAAGVVRAARTARLHDPGRLALRRAARVAITLPLLLALGLETWHSPQMAAFAAFGTFSMLVFADFGGPPATRAAAYGALTGCGALLIVAGTLLSGATWLAAAGMAAVGFVVVFAGVLGGYVAAGGFAALLAFVLAVITPATVADLPARLLGWGAAGAVSMIAALALWPARQRQALRRLAAAAGTAVAGLVAVLYDSGANLTAVGERRTRAASAVAALERFYAAAPYRPAGPTVHDQAFAYLVRELRWVLQSADELAAGPAPPETSSPDDRALAAAAAGALRNAAATLVDPRRPVDLTALEQARRDHMEALRASLGATPDSRNAARAGESRLYYASRVRILAFAALSAAANAALTARAPLVSGDPDGSPLVPHDRPVRRLTTELLSHLRLASVWCQAGIRAAIALAAAAVIARVGNFEHGFWVVLAALSVLKSRAADTRHTAWQAFAGTVAGFAVASALSAALGGPRPAPWVALPICAFLAAYTPTAVHFVIGQSMFTVLVVVLFNLIQPEGWRTGLVRLEDIVIGIGTAVIVGALFWPRGARGQLRACLRALFETGAAYVAAAARSVLGRGSDDAVAAAHTACLAANLRADDAFATFLNEHGPKQPPISTWSDLLVGGGQLRVVGEALTGLRREHPPVPELSDVTREMDGAVGNLEQAIIAAGYSIAPDPRRSPAALRLDAGARDPVELVAEAGRATPAIASDAGMRDIVHVAWVAAWIVYLRRALDRLTEAVAQVRGGHGD